VKVGDLVRLMHNASIGDHDLSNKTGIITEVTQPTPILPYQVATIAFNDIICDGIPAAMIEVISQTE
jgi:hypothetical protein